MLPQPLFRHLLHAIIKDDTLRRRQTDHSYSIKAFLRLLYHHLVLLRQIDKKPHSQSRLPFSVMFQSENPTETVLNVQNAHLLEFL